MSSREVRGYFNNSFTPLRNPMADPQTEAELLNSQTALAFHNLELAGKDTIPNGNSDGGAEAHPQENTGMSPEEFHGAVRAQYIDAKDVLQQKIPEQAAAIRAYWGEGPVIEEEGRSQVTLTEVRNTILAIEEPLYEILLSCDTPVEFEPSSPEDEEAAQQITAYVNRVIMQDNEGHTNFASNIRDSLTCGTGIAKVRWSEDKEITEKPYTGITAEQIATYLQKDPSIQIKDLVEEQTITGPDGQPLQTYSCRLRREIKHDGTLVDAVPPEEFMIARNAISIEKSAFTAHVRDLYVWEVVAMGYPQEKVEEFVGSAGASTMQSLERVARNPANYNNTSSVNTSDRTMMTVQFIEAFARVDKDGDGYAEMRKIHALGDMQYILHDEITDDNPFALFQVMPEPHTTHAQSVAKQVMHFQDIKTNLFRNGLDEYALTVHPQRAYLRGQVNPDDLYNTDPGALIEIYMPGAITELNRQFDGNSLQAMLNYVDLAKEQATGMSQAAQGLVDPSVLQNTVKAGVLATVNSAQARSVTYARNIANGGMKRLYRLVAKTIRANQDIPRTVELNGKWVTVDPRTWIGDLQVTVNAGLGKGTAQDKMVFLNGVAQRQEAYIQNYGVFNPVAPVDKLSNTLAQLVKYGGFQNNTKYFNEITPQQAQQMQQAQAQQAHQPPQPNPQLIEAQAAAAQAQSEAQLSLAKFHWQQIKDAEDAQLAREKAQQDFIVKMTTAYLQHGREIDSGVLDQMIQHQDNVASQNLAAVRAQAEHQINLAQIPPNQPPAQPNS